MSKSGPEITRRNFLKLGAAAAAGIALSGRLPSGLINADYNDIKEYYPATEVQSQYGHSIATDGNNMLVTYTRGLTKFDIQAQPFTRSLKLNNNLDLETSDAIPLFSNLQLRYPFVEAIFSLVSAYNPVNKKFAVFAGIRDGAGRANIAYQLIGLDGIPEPAITLFPENTTIQRAAPACVILPGGTVFLTYCDYRNGSYNPIANYLTISPDLEISAEQRISDEPAAFPAVSFNPATKRGIISWTSFPNPCSGYSIFDENGQIIQKRILDGFNHDSAQSVVSTPDGHYFFSVGIDDNPLHVYQLSPDGDIVNFRSIAPIDGNINFSDALLAPDNDTILFASHVRIGSNYDISMIQWDPRSNKILENRTYGLLSSDEVFPKVVALQNKRITTFLRFTDSSRLVVATSDIKGAYRTFSPLVSQ